MPIVLAANIETSETIITLEKSTASIENHMILTSKEDIGNLTLIMPPEFEDLKILIDGEKINCLLQLEFARCGTVTNGTHTLNTSYKTHYPIASVGDNTIIKYTDKLPYPAEKQMITIKLPVGYIIPREKGKDESFYITPKTKETYSDGQRIILYWEQKGQELPISIIARQVIGGLPAWWVPAILAALLIAGTTTWFVVHKTKAKTPKPTKKKTIIPTLIDNEQKIVNFLKENGEVWQKQIQQATSFSKAKVSRILRNLEERGVITKTIYGNTNKIALKH